MAPLFDAARQRLGYLLHYNDNIEALRREAKELAGCRDCLLRQVVDAEWNPEIIEFHVKNWMEKVHIITAQAKRFLEDEVKAKKKWRHRWCTNLNQRYQFSKMAREKARAISQLQDEEEFEKVSYPRIIDSPMRESLKKELVEALKDENVSRIGICGMGGVGKTTLVKEIGEKVREGKLYDSVVMAVVSQAHSLKHIQEEIAKMLGLTLSDAFDSERASSLWEGVMKEKRILIILDDVWGRIELVDIGIPLRKHHVGCKVVLTSRSETVCFQMACQRIFTVGTLSKQESWFLFKEIAGPNVENSDISPIARESAARCGGLPITIVMVAGALTNQDNYLWIDAAKQLKMSTPTNIKGIHENLLSFVELSFNNKSEEAKSLFLFCCLYPANFNIPIEDLVRYGTGLRWFKDLETAEDIRARIREVVSTLISSYLLIAGDNECVKMHDVVRDLAITMAPKYNHKFMVKASTGQLKVDLTGSSLMHKDIFDLPEWPSTDTYEDLTGISLMCNGILPLKEWSECPKLQILLLQNNNAYRFGLFRSFSNTLFRGMKDLKILNLSKIELCPLPESISLLENLRTLHLNHCKLSNLSVIGKLSNLEILGLLGSDVDEIPTSFSRLSHLRLLDLNWCESEKPIITDGVIPYLSRLEELYMICIISLERNGRQLVEVESLSRLSRLQICFPDPNILSNGMPFKNLTSFILLIGLKHQSIYWSWYHNTSLFQWVKNASRYSRSITLSDMSISEILDWDKYLLMKTENLFLRNISGGSKNILGDLVKEGFSNLRSLTVEFCEELKNLFNPSILKSMVNLRELYLLGCSMLEEIVTNEEGEKGESIERMVFPSLVDMKLEDLCKLTCFSSGLYVIEFPALERLQIEKCPKMKTFGYGEVLTPKLNKVQLEDQNRWMGNINNTVQQFFNDR